MFWLFWYVEPTEGEDLGWVFVYVFFLDYQKFLGGCAG